MIFSNSGTISKFNRMGVLAGFGSPRVRLVRKGFAFDHDPNASAPRAFSMAVNDSAYDEIWSEGLDVWHNPNARHPLDPRLLPYGAHHTLRSDGQIHSAVPEWQPIGSITYQTIVEG